MHYKLTEQVWWGDRYAIREVGQEVKAVLNVADNINHDYTEGTGPMQDDDPNKRFHPGDPDFYHHNILPPTTPYYHLAHNDHEPVDLNYLTALSSIIDVVHLCGHYPFLVHCWLGSHRSSITAVYAVLMSPTERPSRERYEELRAFQRTQLKIHVGAYAKSLEAAIHKELTEQQDAP